MARFAERYGLPVAETQAGKGALPWEHPNQAGALGVTGASAANTLAAEADLVLAIGTRLSDFTTASHSLFADPEAVLVQLNVQPFDAIKHSALPFVADARRGLEALEAKLGDWRAPSVWTARTRDLAREWNAAVERATRATNAPLPSDAQVLGAANRAAGKRDVVVCAAGGLPGELHKLWRTPAAGGYHLEYGYSCMGYEIAGGLGVKMADPTRQVFVLLGDGSYLMMNSEIATSVLMGRKLIIVVLDNRGFGCINRLQKSVGGESFNNLFDAVRADGEMPAIDFAAHAASLAPFRKRWRHADLEAALERAKAAEKTTVIVTTPTPSPPPPTVAPGGTWRCPRFQSGRRCARRARPTSPRPANNEREDEEMGVRIGHQPADLDQRRHAGTGWRDAAGGVPQRDRAGRLRRHRAWQQVPAPGLQAEADPRAPPPRPGLRLVQRPPADPQCRRRKEGSGESLEPAFRHGLRGHGFRRGVTLHPRRAADLAVAPPGAGRAPTGRPSASG